MPDIYGRHPVLEALRHDGGVSRILIAKGAHETQPIQAILHLAREAGLPVDIVERRVLDMRSGGGVHQGIMAVVEPFAYATVDAILSRAQGQTLLVLALDSIQDPQNLGALLRTAEATGVHGVLLPEHRSAAITAAVEKASAGAARLVPVVQVTNLVRALQDMKRAGAWVAGVENDPSAPAYDRADLTSPLVVVLGSEGRGLGRLVRETCDFLIRLPMLGRLSSLNVAIAASVVLYEVLRQRKMT
jgi:23S rRNA (guanosine2251-2'-O)-methyltransferase